MAALTALASAQQRDPISGKALVTIPSCKDAYLHGIFVQYRIPASFPRPESEGTASEVFRCEDVRVEFFKTPESNYLPERIRVSAGNWMKAWAFITKGNGEKNYVSPLVRRHRHLGDHRQRPGQRQRQVQGREPAAGRWHQVQRRGAAAGAV
ncbi:hypothetical protein GCM10010842_37480 [Deinococcus daejeonensis]|uniref:Uncharacterized protein n=1 Tax=Deinococcus daejeonensis TaxID=1007098 RepID=A0ABQ2JJD2_9DEIO|nr:hypothetical protein GCM10010842_37480 [Deinococcus daejeonensis]